MPGVSSLDEVLARLDRVEAELALHRLAYDYCVGADHRDPRRWAAVWTPDAVWETGPDPDHTFVGIDAIRGAVERQWRAFPVMQHATSNHTVDVDGDRATGRAEVTVLVQLPDGRWIVGGGTYADEYRRDGGTWRIARRRVLRAIDLAPLAGSTGPLIYDEKTGTVGQLGNSGSTNA